MDDSKFRLVVALIVVVVTIAASLIVVVITVVFTIPLILICSPLKAIKNFANNRKE